MKINVYTICYNEEVMLPYFFAHYKTLADSITVYDNTSTDRSASIARDNGATVLTFDTGGRTRDDVMLDIKESCWRGVESDWVMVVDVDEFLYHENLLSFLLESKQAGYTAINPQGYQMIGRKMPRPGLQIYQQLRTGMADSRYSKLCCFDPKEITSIGYSVGCHLANPQGRVVKRSGPKLLHYNHLTLEWHLRRSRERGDRLSDLNLSQGWGINYLKADRSSYNRLLSHATEVV